MIFKATIIANTPALCSFSSAILILVRFAVGLDLLAKLEAKNATDATNCHSHPVTCDQ